MFTAHCPAEGRAVLLTERRILRVELSEAQVSITFRCWCGAVGRATDPRPGRGRGRGNRGGGRHLVA